MAGHGKRCECAACFGLRLATVMTLTGFAVLMLIAAMVKP